MKTLFAAIAILIGTLPMSAQRGYHGGGYHGGGGYYGGGHYGGGHYEYRPVFRPHIYVAPRPFYRPVPLFIPRPVFFPPVIGVHINACPPVRHVYTETYVEHGPAAAMSDYDFNNAKNSIYTRTTD